MPNPDTWYAYFHVSGSFDPDEVTRRVGIAPTRIAKEGDVSRFGNKLNCSRWELRSRLDMSAPLELHVKDVLDQLDANRVGFQGLSRAYGGTMELVGYFREHEPGVSLKRELVERMAWYGLTLDCDFYSIGRAAQAVNTERGPKPGDTVVLMHLPPGFLDDLPLEDQTAIREVLGRPVRLNEYEDDGRVEIEFTDRAGVTHMIYVTPEHIRPNHE